MDLINETENVLTEDVMVGDDILRDPTLTKVGDDWVLSDPEYLAVHKIEDGEIQVRSRSTLDGTYSADFLPGRYFYGERGDMLGFTLSSHLTRRVRSN